MSAAERELAILRERFPGVPRVALTATADAQTRAQLEKLAAQWGDVAVRPATVDDADGLDRALAGAAAVMPLGAPIGTNRGLKTRELVRILI